MDVYLNQLCRVVKTHDLRFRRYVVTDGAYSKQKFVAGVWALELHQIVKRGKTARGTHCYLCHNQACATGSFLLDYHNRGCLPEVKELIIDMSLNASRVRDTALSLHISTDTVLRELKQKEPVLECVNTALLNTLNPDEVTIAIERAGEVEMDEMWSFVRRKNNPAGSGMPLITTREPC
jgi:hypothetical protein